MKVKEFSVKKVSISDIKFDETNPNVVSKDQMDALGKGIKKFGNLSPVILNEDMQILDGEHRVRIYEKMGEQSIPAYVVNVNKIDGKMLRQVMNKLRGEHDKNKDAEEFKALFDAGKLDLFSKLMAKPKEEFEQVLEKKFNMEFETPQSEEIPELPKVAKSKVGEIYQLGNHRIMCGSSGGDISKLMKDVQVDLMVPDPPYGVDYGSYNEFLNSYDRGARIDADIINDNLENYDTFFKEFLEKIPFADYSCYYIFMGYSKMREVLTSLNDLGYYNAAILIWVKNQFVVGRADYNPQHEQILYGWKTHHKFYGGNTNSTVFFEDKPRTNELHPTMKPVKLVAKLIKHGSQKGMNVYDPFLGSGTTLIACEETGRFCYGYELEPLYVDVIIQRWETLTGKKAKKIGG